MIVYCVSMVLDCAFTVTHFVFLSLFFFLHKWNHIVLRLILFHLTVIALAISQQDPGWDREKQKGCGSLENKHSVCVCVCVGG